MKLVVATIAAVALLLVAAPIHADTHPPHWTDGTTCEGGLCPGGPPPAAPHWKDGQACKIDMIDPPGVFVFITEHFDFNNDGTEDASAVFPYHATAPAFVEADVESIVAGHAGTRWDTWNIGEGETAKVPFDCTTPATTTTEQTTTTTTVATSPNVMPPATPVPAQPSLTG